jgi:multidrug efflux pump subunit AcrB
MVFVPLAFTAGVVGQFFLSLSLALAIAILISMLVSVTVIPVLTARYLAGRPMPSPGRVYQFFEAKYETMLRAVVHWPKLTLAASVLVIVPAAWIFTHVESGFMPDMDEGAFVLDYFMPVGTSLAETDRVMRRVEAVLLDTPDVAAYVRRTGAELGFFATEPFTGDVLVSLKPPGERRSMQQVIEAVRARLESEVPQLEVEFVPLIQDQINDLAGVEAPVEIKLFGSDYAVLRRLAGEVGAAVESTEGCVDVDPHVRQGNPDMIVHVDSVEAERVALSTQSVEEQLNAAMYGQVAATLPEKERLTNIRVRYPDRVRFNLHRLGTLPLEVPGGGYVPLDQLAQLEHARSLNELWRENQQPTIFVTAEIEGRDLGSVVNDLRPKLARIALPPGYRWELSGNYETQQRSFLSLLIVLVVAALLVFLLLAFQFRSLALPLLVFLTQPLSLTAALAALWITGVPLNVSSLMGAIMLVGLDVKNGIILIEYIGQLRVDGMGLREALVQAGRVRFRPILMTSLTTILGLFPLALGLGPGAQMQQPLAVAVIGGLTANMLFTRLIIPPGYELIARFRERATIAA